MKSKSVVPWCSSILAVLLVAGFSMNVQAQTVAGGTNYIVDQFDTDTTGDYANQGWGAAVPIIVWDDTQNATTTVGPNNPGSGSALWSITWPTTADQIMVVRSFDNGDALNLNNYTNISFDIMFDSSSATDGAGSYGELIVCCVPSSDGWPSTALATYTSVVTNGNGWIHVNLPINASSISKLDDVTGVAFNIQQNRTGANLTGTTMYWLDNVIFGAYTNVPPPPKMSVAPVTTPPGLMIVAGGSGGTYTRGLMMAFDVTNGTRNFSWVGQGTTPVTYSQTMVSYPSTNYPIQSAIFLVQNGNFGDPGVDYDAANVAQLSIYGNADGTATGSFEYKTNQSGGNSQFQVNSWSLTAPSPVGTWSLTFVDDTNVTLSYVPLSGVGGVSTNVVGFMGESDVQTYFGNPLSVFMGNQQNGDGNLGQSSTYSEFKISGITISPPLDDVWSAQNSIDTTNWGIVDYSADNIFLVHPTDKYWVNWTVPASGFNLEVSTNLSTGWSDPGLISAVNTSVNTMVLLPSMATNLPASGSVFFRLANTNSP
jgi:hypothetical protein